MKQKIAFALLMGIITTGFVMFMVVLVNTGLSAKTFLNTEGRI